MKNFLTEKYLTKIFPHGLIYLTFSNKLIMKLYKLI